MDQESYAMSAGFILEFKYQTKHSTVDIDINVNKYLEVLNSHLISCYCKMDARFRHCALIIKDWYKSKCEEMKILKADRLNSYCLYMMLLAFMIHQKYLPNLQQ